jgi:hypothetical protein
VGYIDTRFTISLVSGADEFTGVSVSAIYLGSVLEGTLVAEGAHTEFRGQRIGL